MRSVGAAECSLGLWEDGILIRPIEVTRRGPRRCIENIPRRSLKELLPRPRGVDTHALKVN